MLTQWDVSWDCLRPRDPVYNSILLEGEHTCYSSGFILYVNTSKSHEHLFHSKEFSEFRKARSNMLLSRKNQLLLEFSFWNEPIPRSGPNIYELRSYQLRVSPGTGVHHVPSFFVQQDAHPWCREQSLGICSVMCAWLIFSPVQFFSFPFLVCLFLYFFFFCCAVCGILVPWPGIKPMPLFIGSRES